MAGIDEAMYQDFLDGKDPHGETYTYFDEEIQNQSRQIQYEADVRNGFRPRRSANVL